MRVLILGPNHAGGSLPPYLDVLTAGLRGHGITVHRNGSSGIPYEKHTGRFWPLDRVLTEARALANGVDLAGYDLVSAHSGNLELDQLIPTLWAESDRTRPPVVYNVHTLAPTLFRDHLPDPHALRLVHHAFQAADGYIYFGRYAATQLADTVPDGAPAAVAWLPTTIPPGTTPTARPALAAALKVPSGWPVISLYGYAAPWKDAALLLAALERMRHRVRIVLAGEFWDDPTQAGIDLSPFRRPVRFGAGELVVVPGYLGPADRAALVSASAAGVFPYRAHPSFQGSGAIADYLAHATPVIATDVANMPELIAHAGQLVPPNDPPALATALEGIAAGDTTATQMTRNATLRAHHFTAEAHAAQCLTLYQRVLDHRRRY